MPLPDGTNADYQNVWPFTQVADSILSQTIVVA